MKTYTVTIEMSVTAQTMAEAAKYALDDITDKSISPLFIQVKNDHKGVDRIVKVDRGDSNA